MLELIALNITSSKNMINNLKMAEYYCVDGTLYNIYKGDIPNFGTWPPLYLFTCPILINARYLHKHFSYLCQCIN